AMQYSLSTETHVAHGLIREPGLGGFLQMYEVQPIYAYVRFRDRKGILTYDEPPPDPVFPTGLWHYGRGRANVGLGRLDEAQADLDALKKTIADPELAKLGAVGFNSGTDILSVAAASLAGELAAAKKDYPAAIAHLREGVRREDALAYNEPA